MGHNATEDTDHPVHAARDPSDTAAGPSLALVDDPLFDEHWSARAQGHPERPERLAASRAGLAALQLEAPELRVHRLAPRDAAPDELLLVHEPRYVETLAAAHGQDGHFDADTYFGERSAAAALRAAGGALALVERLMRREEKAGVALLRPPGHHARPSGAMGFCLLNNVALAAARALTLGARRVAIVDWDVHHGNGTEEVFYDDPRVLYVSLHQSPLYPGTGAAADVGQGIGRGFNVNVPLSAGATSDVYREAFAALVSPILAAYAPDVLLVSAGYDAHARDPLGGMRLDDASYGDLMRSLLEATDGAPVGVFLEGGYDLAALQGAVAETCRALAGRPSRAPHEGTPGDTRFAEELARARRAQGPYWRL